MKTVSKAASAIAGMIIFLVMSIFFVVSYVFLGLWFVVIPAVIGAILGSKVHNDNKAEEGFSREDLMKFEEALNSMESNSNIH